MARTYKWKQSEHFNISAQSAGEELDRLRKKTGGNITPDDVLDAARSKSSPLHAAFTWDDSEAAEQWRKSEARKLISSVQVVHVTPEGPKRVQAYVSVVVGEEGRKYVPTETAMMNDEMRDSVLEEAMQQLDAWARRYNHLKELRPIFEAMKKVKQEA